MKKFVGSIITLATLVVGFSTFAGAGYFITIHNNLPYQIQYNSISQYSWYRNDIPKEWTVINANSSSPRLYTEHDSSENSDVGYILIGLENTQGVKFGTVGVDIFDDVFADGYITYPPDWHNMTLNDDFFPSDTDYVTETGQYPDVPIITETTTYNGNQYVVDVEINP